MVIVELANAHARSQHARPHPPRSRAPGFTIVEVMVAATVMVLAITSSITVLQRGFSSLDTARKITLAGQILQSEMEKMRLQDWSKIAAYSKTAENIPLDSTFTENEFVKRQFTKLERVAEDVNMGTGVGMRKITLTVYWTSYDGRSLSRSYISFYGQRGLYDYFYNSW